MATTFRQVLAKNNGQVRICEVHDRASTELVRSSVADNDQSFDGVWISGLTQTTILGLQPGDIFCHLLGPFLFSASSFFLPSSIL